MANYAIKVIWANGEEEFVKQGLGDTPALFHSRMRAGEQADFMRMGMDDDECQSINVVPYPCKRADGE